MTHYTRKLLDKEARWAADCRRKADKLSGRPCRVSWELVLDGEHSPSLLVTFSLPNCEHPFLTNCAI